MVKRAFEQLTAHGRALNRFLERDAFEGEFDEIITASLAAGEKAWSRCCRAPISKDGTCANCKRDVPWRQ